MNTSDNLGPEPDIEGPLRAALIARAAHADLSRARQVVDRSRGQVDGARPAASRNRAIPAFRRPGILLAAAAAVAAVAAWPVLAGGPNETSASDPQTTGSSRPPVSTDGSTDCLSGLVVGDSAYRLALGPAVRTFPLSEPVGKGTIPTCSEQDESLGGGRAVVIYELQGVPTSQAVLVEDSEGEGNLFLSLDLTSANDVAPGLEQLLKEMRISLPTR